MGLVIGIIALVTLNYWQLVRAFPEGGGSPEAAGRAFGEAWSFLPIGALVVDFALTIAISIAAAGSALIALVPALAPARIPWLSALVVAVAALTWFGHGGRLIFAVMTCLFIVAAVPMLALGFIAPHIAHGQRPDHAFGEPGAGGGHPRVPGSDGARDGHGGAGHRRSRSSVSSATAAAARSAAGRWR